MNNDGGMAFHLSGVPWEYFGSLTFDLKRDKHVSQGRALRRVFVLLRELACRRHVHFLEMLWAVRWEKGEKGGLWHLHYLIAGTGKPSLQTTYVLQWLWAYRAGGGFSVNRLYDTSQAGVSYILKCLDVQEMSKFSDCLEVSKSTIAWLRARRRRGLAVVGEVDALADRGASVP